MKTLLAVSIITASLLGMIGISESRAADLNQPSAINKANYTNSEK